MILKNFLKILINTANYLLYLLNKFNTSKHENITTNVK